MHAKWLKWGTWCAGLLVVSVLGWQVRMEDSKPGKFDPDSVREYQAALKVRTEDNKLWQFDRQIADDARENAKAHPDLQKFAGEATHVGGTQALVAVVAVAAILLCMVGHPRLAAIWILSAVMGMAINRGVKEIVQRPRPQEGMVSQKDYSFPSGHAMGSVLGFGPLAYVGWVLLRGRTCKIAVTLLVVGTIALIGWTRIYLRAHWCSDVIGGWILGLCWLAVCVKVGGGKG